VPLIADYSKTGKKECTQRIYCKHNERRSRLVKVVRYERDRRLEREVEKRINEDNMLKSKLA